MLENCHKFKESYYNVMKTAPKNILQQLPKYPGLVNFIPESYFLFAQIRSLYRKTAAKAWNWYQRCDFTNGTRISVWNIPSGKTGLPFRMFPVGPGNFPPTRPYPMYFFIFHHEEDRICLTTLSGADRTKKINLTLPIIIPPPRPPPLEMARKMVPNP